MTNVLNNQDLRDSNSSAISAMYRVLIRRPWKTWVFSAWKQTKQALQVAGFTALMVIFMPSAPAQAQTYHSVNADVPFEFTVGAQKFSPGSYELVLRGNSMLVLRDPQNRILAVFYTHEVTAKGRVIESKLVFTMKDGHQQLHQIMA